MNKLNLSYDFFYFLAGILEFFNKIFFSKFGVVLCPTIWNKKERKKFIYKYYDYIRISSLELVAGEIYENKINGNVAELGVFQGRFAQYINQAFPDRKLYLFDTFEGFHKNDIENEKKQGGMDSFHDFSKTSTESVLKKMKYRENCIIKKGFFPETAKDVDDTFVFVNIDVDLFAPAYNGLVFFYPRLQKGGCIFIHDFNDTKMYTGVKAAVKKYCRENSIPYFPLTDGGGSAVIVK